MTSRYRSARIPVAGGRPRPGAGGEQGFILVLAILIMFILTILGTTSILNSTIENKISDNDYKGNQALYAADGALQSGMTVLNGGAVPAGYPVGLPLANDSKGAFYNPENAALIAWRYPSGTAFVDPSVDADLQFGNRSMGRWYMKFKTDDTGHIVYYNQASGYTDAYYQGGDADADGDIDNADDTARDQGYPVVQVYAEGMVSTDGTWGQDNRLAERNLLVEIGREPFNVKVEGAVTSRSTVDMTGNILIDGNGHDANGVNCDDPGNTCGCTADMPGVFVDTGKVVNQGGSAAAAGTPPTQVNPDVRPLPKSPWEALGISFDQMPSPIDPASSSDPFNGFVWVAGDVNIDAGQGILVVHNLNFSPDVWQFSDPASADYNTAHGNYDAHADSNNAPCTTKPSDPGSPPYNSATCYDETFSPATFGANGNGTIKGVIIADRIDKINGTNTIVGAVISLTSIEAGKFGNGTANILYSCDAIQQYAQTNFGIKLLWKKM
jgi:hypothetical protein